MSSYSYRHCAGQPVREVTASSAFNVTQENMPINALKTALDVLP